MLELHDLHKRYGDVVALDGVSLSVKRGQLVGFLGPNGAGKTTAMRAILRVVQLDRGTITWDGHPVDEDTRRRIGYMPAERGLYPAMRVAEHIEYLGRLAGLDAPSARRATRTWLERLDLAGRADDEVRTLSTGNMQRVQLALALVHEPELLVLDEPFSGLDPLASTSMRAILEELLGGGTAVLFSSHQLDLVQDLARDVVIVHRGATVLSGDVSTLRSASPHRFVELSVTGEGRHRLDDLEDELFDRFGSTVVRRTAAAVRLRVSSEVDARQVVEAAARVPEVVGVSYGPPDLSEVFAEAVRW
ncbi:MAG: ATP-binding cassette domain-containing protein [Acidimicrobiia bacterium]|nr:ATP-binding cassette domain-containing protein [Acidimicrobiia bacterium]